jgi:hypothetical protein
LNGGESWIVCELSSVVWFELEAFAEPKALAKADLERLFREEGTIQAVARRSGLGWSTVQERMRPSRRWNGKKRKFESIRS